MIRDNFSTVCVMNLSVSLVRREAVDRLIESQYLDPFEDDELRSLKVQKNFGAILRSKEKV